MNQAGKDDNGIKHMVFMVLACIIPLAIIILLSIFGISSKWTTIGAIALMVFLHVFMMKNHFNGGKK